MNHLQITNEHKINYQELLSLNNLKIEFIRNSCFKLATKIDKLTLRETPAFCATEYTTQLKNAIDLDDVILEISFCLDASYSHDIEIFIKNTLEKDTFYKNKGIVDLVVVADKNKILSSNNIIDYKTFIKLNNIFSTNKNTSFFTEFKKSTIEYIVKSYIKKSVYELKTKEIDLNDTKYSEIKGVIDDEKFYLLVADLIIDKLILKHDVFLSDLLSSFEYTYKTTSTRDLYRCDLKSGENLDGVSLYLEYDAVVEFYNLQQFKTDLDTMLIDEINKIYNLFKQAS